MNCIVEGNSIRSTARLTNSSKDTVMRLQNAVGEACANFHHNHVVNLPCRYIQVDEVWSFIRAKEKNVHQGIVGKAGDAWLWTSICNDTKIIPTWYIGLRDAQSAHEFAQDLASRLANRIQLTSDGNKVYLKAIENAFGHDIDYRMLIKHYDQSKDEPDTIIGTPDDNYMHNNYIERSNLTLRMCNRRFTRKTNAFSKRVENHINSVSLTFTYYNFCRMHKTIKTTPAIAAGVTDRVMTLEEIVEMSDRYWENKK
nr:IS1 family transposase [Vampirovibrio chlorellavorus]